AGRPTAAPESTRRGTPPSGGEAQRLLSPRGSRSRRRDGVAGVPTARAESAGGRPASSLPDSARRTGSTPSRSRSSTSTGGPPAAAVVVVEIPAPARSRERRDRDTGRPEPGRSTTPRRRSTTSPTAQGARHEPSGRRATGPDRPHGSARYLHAASAGPHVRAGLPPRALVALPPARTTPA